MKISHNVLPVCMHSHIREFLGFSQEIINDMDFITLKFFAVPSGS